MIKLTYLAIAVSICAIAFTSPAYAKKSKKTKIDYTALTCLQLQAELDISKINIEIANDAMNQANSVYRHSNPYGQSSPTMSAFNQGLASSSRNKATAQRNAALKSFTSVSREIAARPCGQNSQQAP